MEIQIVRSLDDLNLTKASREENIRVLQKYGLKPLFSLGYERVTADDSGSFIICAIADHIEKRADSFLYKRWGSGLQSADSDFEVAVNTNLERYASEVVFRRIDHKKRPIVGSSRLYFAANPNGPIKLFVSYPENKDEELERLAIDEARRAMEYRGAINYGLLNEMPCWHIDDFKFNHVGDDIKDPSMLFHLTGKEAEEFIRRHVRKGQE